MNGIIIKHLRLEKGMKQIWLAQGICSTSYLSKIESNQVSPSEEIFSLLLKRLGVKFTPSFHKDEMIFEEEVYELYKEAIEQRNYKEINLKYQNLLENNKHLYFYENYLMYLVYFTRIELILNQFKKDINIIDSLFNGATSRQIFLHKQNKALYYYLNGNYNEAYILVESLFETLEFVYLKKWEEFDFYNIASIILLKNKQYIKALNYANSALSYYQKNLIYDKIIDLYLVIGIANKNVGNYSVALSNYELCQKLITDLNDKKYQGTLYQNMGNLYSFQNLSKEALDYYSRSLSFKENIGFDESYFITLLSIIKEYSKTDEYYKVQKWAKKGLIELEESSLNNIRIKTYQYHFKIYYLKHKGDDLDIFDYIKQALDHFSNLNDFINVQKYSLLIAKLYKKQFKYKEASYYYDFYIDSCLKISKIKHWEDL